MNTTEGARREAATIAFKQRFNAIWEQVHVVTDGRCKSCGKVGSKQYRRFHG